MIVAGVVVILILVLVAIVFSGYKKAPPDTAFIISGMRKKIIIGKASVKVPFLERMDKLSLKLIAIDVKTTNSVPTADYINIQVDAAVNVKVSSEPKKLALASENFLNQNTQYTANIAFAGFTAPKILWVKENEPENFAKICKIMLPKDYLAYKLSGSFCTDYSDASGMLLLDVQHKCWSKEMMEICGIREEQLAKLYESYEVVGTLKPEVAAELGLPESCKIVAGAGDNAAAAVGTGTVGDGMCNVSLGTSGTIFISSENFGVDSNNALHAFAHADGHYHLMGCMLSAASCNKWWMDEIIGTKDYSAEQAKITKLGENNVFFLPYLMGERSPHNNPNARGTFIGLTMDTTRADMTQAVLEGVAFAIRDSFEVAKSLGIQIERTKICGGGAKSPLWKKMIANILNIKVDSIESEEGPAMGGAMLAAVANGEFASVEDAAAKIVKVTETIEPEPELVAKYEEKYRKFAKIYPTVKDLFSELL